jgi:hypothetical protein
MVKHFRARTIASAAASGECGCRTATVRVPAKTKQFSVTMCPIAAAAGRLDTH